MAACSAAPTGSGGYGTGATGGKADGDDEAATIQDVAAALQGDGVLEMSDTARREGANESSAEVTVASLDGEFREYFASDTDALIAKHFGYDPETFPGHGVLGFVDPSSDVHVQVRYGYMDPQIRKVLLSAVSDDSRAAVRGLLSRFHGMLYHVEAYDNGAEVIGVDYFLLRSSDEEDKQVVRVEIAYDAG